MNNTGERLYFDSPKLNVSEYYIHFVHLATYAFAKKYMDGKKVLDLGCGSGYGTFGLSSSCKHITGVDISEEAILYAKSKYSKPNLNFVNIDDIQETKLPFKDESFDMVISFQVIEHIPNTNEFLSEAKRVLKTEGILIIATPNRENRLFGFQRPWNIFHVKEFSGLSLKKYLCKYFSEEKIQTFGISASTEIVKHELKRTNRLKWITMPFTLKIFPEWWRQGCLRLLKKIQSSAQGVEISVRFNETDIIIGELKKNCTDLVALVIK